MEYQCFSEMMEEMREIHKMIQKLTSQKCHNLTVEQAKLIFLIAHQQMNQKEIAQKLAPMVCFDYYSKEPSKMNFDMTYNRSHDPNDMVKAYISAVGRGKAKLPPPKDAFSGIVSRKIVSVSSKIITVMRKLYKGKTVKYSSLFEAAEGRSDLIATFLAVLELVKGKRVRVEGDGDNAEVKMI